MQLSLKLILSAHLMLSSGIPLRSGTQRRKHKPQSPTQLSRSPKPNIRQAFAGADPGLWGEHLGIFLARQISTYGGLDVTFSLAT